MTPELKAAWIAALRSGEYSQAREQLHDATRNPITGQISNSYCCLGVLCEVAQFPEWDGRTIRDPENEDRDCLEELPSAILERIALPELTAERLMIMNDTERADFREIAAYIEEHIT